MRVMGVSRGSNMRTAIGRFCLIPHARFCQRWWLPCWTRFGSLLLCVLTLQTCMAQVGRYELGQRLRRFELAWQGAEAGARRQSTAAMETAVRAFFSMQWTNALQQLDQAYLAVLPTQARMPETVLRQALLVRPYVADVPGPPLSIELRDAYAGEGTIPDQTRVTLQIVNYANGVLAETSLPFREVSKGVEWPGPNLPSGDYHLQATIHATDRDWHLPEVGFSRVERLDERLDALRERIKSNSAEKNTIWQATAAHHLDIVRSMHRGRRLEIDYPADQFLAIAEHLVENRALPTFLSDGATHDEWLVLVRGESQLTVRIRPPQPAGDTMPVLIAFHGAGGSENMFFESYGAGRTMELATARGWLAVAPRQEWFGLSMNLETLLDCLEESFPIDRLRVYLVGHSMGANQVVQQVVASPQRVAAAAAIGGGGQLRDASVLKDIPFFVATGDRDFGRSGARRLADVLRESGTVVDYREYTDIEHMVVMQAALDDLFAFFHRYESTRK